MKNQYVVSFTIRNYVIIKAKSKKEAKTLFTERQKVKSGVLQIDDIQEFDSIEADVREISTDVIQ